MSDGYEYLESVFHSYCAFGSGQRGSDLLDSAKWIKMLRESNMFDRTFSQTDADLVFTRAKQGTRFATAKKVPFEVFADRLVPLVAAKKGIPVGHLIPLFVAPKSSGTRPEYARFHDDKNTYTGVYARGGPSTLDFRPTLQSIVQDHDALTGDVRGIVSRHY